MTATKQPSGAITFTQATVSGCASPSTNILTDMAVTHANNDGYPDVFALCARDFGTGHAFIVFRNELVNNALVYEPELDVALSARPNAVAAGDFNDDGDMDAVVGTSEGFVLLQNQDGGSAFSIFQTVATGKATQDIAVADLDHDGDLEVIVLYNEETLLIYDGARSQSKWVSTSPTEITWVSKPTASPSRTSTRTVSPTWP